MEQTADVTSLPPIPMTGVGGPDGSVRDRGMVKETDTRRRKAMEEDGDGEKPWRICLNYEESTISWIE